MAPRMTRPQPIWFASRGPRGARIGPETYSVARIEGKAVMLWLPTFTGPEAVETAILAKRHAADAKVIWRD